MSNRSIVALVAAAILVFLLTPDLLHRRSDQAGAGAPVRRHRRQPKTEPGLYAKIPLVQDIQRIDRRLLDYEAEEFEIIAGDQKRLVVDAYARYRIVNARLFAETRAGRRAVPARPARIR